MKPMLMGAIMMIAAIAIAATFGLTMGGGDVITVPAAFVGQELYVCPAESSIWNQAATAIRPFLYYITIGFFFATIVLMFAWGWALYQNLIADKFKRDSFSKPWQFTKMLFWVGVIVIIVAATPNHFKTVHIAGAQGEWILCENNTPGARAVRADAVSR